MYKIDKNRALNILGLEYENFIHKLAEGEGSTMTFAQTSATINNLPVDNVRPKDVLVVKCIQNGVDYVMDLLRKDDFFLDKQTLKMINRYVASNDNFDNIGDFRVWPIKIAGAKHRGSNPAEFDDIFFNISEKYNKDKNYDEINLFMDLAKTQFFGNGNKRAGQLMMNGLLVSKGHCPFVINFKEPAFSEALIRWYDNDDGKNLYSMMHKKQIEILKDYLTEQELEEFEKNSKDLTEKEDKKQLLLSVANNGMLLKNLSDKFRDDKEVVLEAVKNNAFALEFASERLKNDKEVVTKAVEKNPLVLVYSNLKMDKEFVKKLSKEHSQALLYADKEIKKEIEAEEKNIDSDLDGLTDKEEILLGTNLYARDTDGDGKTDKEEKIKGKDPKIKDKDENERSLF